MPLTDGEISLIKRLCTGKCVLVISGVPGTGKSAVATELAKALGWKRVNLSEVAMGRGFIAKEDRDRSTYVVNEEALRDWIKREAGRRPLIVDSHYGEIVDDDILLKLFVLRLRPDSLLERLVRRGWHPAKIAENVEAELLGICTANALEEHPREKVCEIDTTGLTVADVVDRIASVLLGKAECTIGVDWLSSPEIVESVMSRLSRLSNVWKPHY